MSQSRDARIWKRIDALFHEAMELNEPARAGFLEGALENDDSESREAIRSEVMRLLALHEGDSAFLESPAVDPSHIEQAAREAQRTGATLNLIGRTVDQYRVKRLIGEGGMGLVYLAEQAHPARDVALKIIRPAFASEIAVKRFEHEVNILARLRHPGIAQIYDAGSAEIDGARLPFFAMELVEGEPVTRFARENDLDLESRIRLLIQIARAVQHAHQQGVIHRDLKPGNILAIDDFRLTISDFDASKSSIINRQSSIVKVLDFGVARLVDSPAPLTLESGGSALIGTIAYMSPEQLAGEADEVDTRSDVYALGVLMYEVLSGALPHDVRGCSIPAAIRRVSDSSPRALAAIDPRLRGDLSAIAAMAVAPEKERRYQSAGELADDLERYLNNEPISARPPGALYIARKFAQRHRGLTIACGMIVLLLIIGGGAWLWQIGQTRQRDARQAAAHEFLGGILAFVNDPAGARDPELIQSLERASAEVETAFAGRPLAEAEVRETLGDACVRLGRLDDAAEHYVRSYEIRKRELGPRDPHTWSSLAGLGSTRLRQQRYEEAASTLNDVVDARRRLIGDRERSTLGSMADLAAARAGLGRAGDAEALYRETLALQREHLGETHRDTLVTALNLANLLRDHDRFDDAEPLYTERVEAFQRLYGENDPETLKAIGDYAIFLKHAGRADEAEPWYLRYMDGFTRLFGDEHPSTLTAAHNYGTFLWSVHRRDAALAVFADATRHARSALAPEDGLSHAIQLRYAEFLKREDRYEAGEEVLINHFRDVQAALGSGHEQTQRIVKELIALYERWEKPEKAAEYQSLLNAE